ncbi:glycosyltransferase [candidate division KSB1 bacterium]|nr:glycosyltransferase [candidate division KSB1 bacterium]
MSNNSKNKAGKNIILISNIPTPYRIPLFTALHAACLKEEMQLTIVFAAKGYERRQWKIDYDSMKFPYHVLASGKIQLGSKEGVLFTYSTLTKILRQLKPDLIISAGFSMATTRIAVRWYLEQYPPYIIWTESVDRPGHNRSCLRMIQRKLLCKGAKSLLVSGSRAADYVQSLGTKSNKIFRAISTVDTDVFLKKTAKIRTFGAKRPARKVILYIGHFTKGKRIDLILHLLQRVLQHYEESELWLVGSGPEYPYLKNLSKDLDIVEHVCFWPFQQQENLYDFYALADCFVFPSQYDVWGMALVEAMASGLPCLASELAGAAVDLINNGENGYLVDFHRINTAVPILLYLFNHPQKAKKIGQTAADSIQQRCHIRNSVAGFMEAIKWSIQ